MLQTPRTEESIFADALNKSCLSERAAFLDAACGADAALRARVERLLSSHENAGSFLNKRLMAPGETTDFGPVTEAAGTVIGRYKLLQSIGEGGFGVVYMAEQKEPVRRKVALKIIKLGMDSKEVIARFEAERQALALMDHPNIAKVFDAGTTETGRPYFVMELVKGIPVAEFCDKNQLPARQRLEIFTAVCQAVQHAHQKGIIHRDIKPSNVLVTLHDGRPVPKVIDFGVAKALNQQLTEKTLFTAFGHMIGTPQYMSPEQAEMSGLDVDTRSDIYSLGVLLYELLTGTTPLEGNTLRAAGYLEMQRIIREEESPLPSVRVSTLGERLSVVAKDRHCEPGQLSQLLRGELDWIVMKTLEKDRTRRYETAASLARDVERYLNNETVEACPPSTVYRMRKFASKYRTPLRVAGAFALVLVAGVLASAWQAIRATAAERAALDSAIDARQNAAVAQDQKRQALAAREDAEKQRDELVALNTTLRRANYIADMNLAWHASEENLNLTRELLDRHRPQPGETDLRGFEWRYLERQFSRDLWSVKAHAKWGGNVYWTPDSKRIYSGGRAESVGPAEFNLWDAAGGRPLSLKLNGSTDHVSQAAFSADGKVLAAACSDKLVRVWNLETGEAFSLEGHKRSVVHVAVSADGKRLASKDRTAFERGQSQSQRETEIKVWDLVGRRQVMSLDRLPGSYWMVPALSPDGKCLAVGSEAGVVTVWEVPTRRELFVLKNLNADPVAGEPAFSTDSKYLAVNFGWEVPVCEVATARTIRTLHVGSASYGHIAFSPEVNRLAAAGGSSVQLWDVPSGRLIHTLKTRSAGIHSIAFSPDGARLASMTIYGDLAVWETTDCDTIPIPVARSDPAAWLHLSPGGKFVMSDRYKGNKTTYLWDAATGRPHGEPLASDDSWTNNSFSDDGKRLALADRAKHVKIWDLATTKLVRTFANQTKRITDIALSPNGNLLAVAEQGGILKIWDIDQGTELRTIPCSKDGLPWLKFSPDGSRLAGTTRAGLVYLWDVSRDREPMTIPIRDTQYIGMTRFSPDGRRLAVAGLTRVGGLLQVLDVENGREVWQLKGHTETVHAIAFSPDGKRLASGSADSTIKLWDMNSGQEILRLNGHTQEVSSLAFSPDGRRLFSASLDHTVRICDATPLPE